MAQRINSAQTVSFTSLEHRLHRPLRAPSHFAFVVLSLFQFLAFMGRCRGNLGGRAEMY